MQFAAGSCFVVFNQDSADHLNIQNQKYIHKLQEMSDQVCVQHDCVLFLRLRLL